MIDYCKISVHYLLLLLLVVWGCQDEQNTPDVTQQLSTPYLMVLGVAQDAGYPQAACKKDCCQSYWDGTVDRAYPSCLALIDEQSGQFWLFEASPEVKFQLQAVYDQTAIAEGTMPSGIFLTHAHIGHYAGLIHFGREVIGADLVPVYVMPRMESFLRANGPWDQLVRLDNVELKPLVADSTVLFANGVGVTPFPVPHRDEYSETVGFKIGTTSQTALFIPDIDKWNAWDKDIRTEVASVTRAYVDGTFFEEDELPGRNMSEIPHPFVSETMALFEDQSAEIRARLHFIHFNHTNRLIWDSNARTRVREAGFGIAESGERFYF